MFKRKGILFYLAILWLTGNTVFAQSLPKITINLKNSTLKEFMSVVESKTSYTFMYNNLNLQETVSVEVNQADLKEVLIKALSPKKISFEITGTRIILKPIAIDTNKSATDKTVSGNVVDEKGLPMIGVSVKIKSTSRGTSTDSKGKFSLNTPNNAVLIFSYTGFLSQEIPVAGKQSISVILKEDKELLDEVIVVGYGIQKKSSMTAAITTVKTSDLENIPRPNVLSALQGRVAGLTISETSGQANANPSIQVRGVGTIDGATSPLILVDGVPTGTIGLIPVNDIESISILKDAAAAAIYGARAANGVILVTTKRGAIHDQKPIIQFNSYFGAQTLAFTPQTLTAYQYASLLNEVYTNEGKDPVFSASDMEQYKNGKVDDFHGNTDWKKEALRNVAPIVTNHLSVSGNGQLGRYYVSGEYVSQQGVIKEIDKYNRINLRANITSDINKHFQLQFLTNYIRTHNTAGSLNDMFYQIQTAAPILPVRYTDGNWGSQIFANGAYLWESGNPTKIIDQYGPVDSYWNTLNSSGSLSYTPIKDLVFKSMLTYRNSWSDSQNYNGSWFSWDPVKQAISQSGPASLNESWSKEYKYDLQFTGDYTKSFGVHNFKALVGYSQESLRSDYISAYRSNFINNSIYELNAGDAATQTNNGGADQWSFASFFGRLNYDYNGKYLFEANLRYDGSSRFAPGKQWGLFPSVSVGWNIAQENFLKENTSIDYLKLRLSAGQLGNAEKVGLYQWFSGVTSGPYYNFDGTLVSGTRTGYLANKELIWETTTSYNAGLDGSFKKGKYTFEIDFWRKNTNDVLLSAPISTIIGSPNSSLTVNAGKVASHGFDISAGTNGNLAEGLRYDVRLSFTAWNSWIVDLKERATAFSTEFRPGEDMGNYYGYQSLGIINDQETLDVYRKLENVAPQVAMGDLQYKDQNGDGRLDYLDYVKIGNYNIKKNFGLNLGLNYKGFDAQAFLQGAFDVDRAIQGETRTSFHNFASPDANQLDRWTEQNRNADALFPRLRKEFSVNTEAPSSFWIKDASYIKLKNLQFGYSFPTRMLSKASIQTLRLYVSGTNLFTFAPDYLKGYDPETDMLPRRYPSLRVFSFGLNLKF
jgi:TonB-linked SusC/RagA family outer membrane protein